MNHDEIRARLERCKAQMEVGEVVYRIDHNWALSTIEALLARESEVLEVLRLNYAGNTQREKQIIAILNPESAALAREKTNG